MKLLFFLSLLLITITYSALYTDNQTDIYVKDYSGDLVKQGNVSFQASRIIIGVKEGVTKDQVDQLAKNIGGEISGWTIVPGLYDSYSIDLPAEKQEFAFAQLKLNPSVAYSIKNYQYDIDYIPEPNETFLLPYEGKVIKDDGVTYFQANTIVLGVKEGTTHQRVEEFITPYKGKITGWIKSADTFIIFLPADQREFAMKDLLKHPEVVSADRNGYSSPESYSDPIEGNNILLSIILLIALILVIGFVVKKFLLK